ncbi:biopolymer transporter ExbD [Alloprevotella tannerae]|uniref:ExbD/TolR family protein n=1 Tax=Alloprevotella tannerae TaxID=76122 RepID=UPI0025F7C6EB|nr:biopolymer transporter ExbD [Alloprevotella tannerae]
MASLGGSKQKKMNSRVDFTPMVDMIMLLVTFFMLCTTLQKPQTMQITMPSNKENINDANRSQVAASKAITIMITENRTLYYFKGKPTDDNLVKTTFGKDGIRAVLMEANSAAQQEKAKLDAKYATMQSSNVQQAEKNKAWYMEQLKEIRNGANTPDVIIKPSDKATYKDLIDVLDEMNICSIGRYVIDKFAPADQAKVDKLNAKK